MDKQAIKYVFVIQCDHSRERCSGFACSNAFFEREAGFEGYGPDTKFIAVTCGGCSGTQVAGYLEHFGKKLRGKTDIKKSEVAVHFATCAVTDNRHHDRCPHIDYMKDIIKKKGFENIVEGTYQSEPSKKMRAMGKYKVYDSVAFD